MFEPKEYICISDLIFEGNVRKIINSLESYLKEGYTALYWDTYDASIYLSKDES